jgi:hypothetical protein
MCSAHLVLGFLLNQKPTLRIPQTIMKSGIHLTSLHVVLCNFTVEYYIINKVKQHIILSDLYYVAMPL